MVSKIYEKNMFKKRTKGLRICEKYDILIKTTGSKRKGVGNMITGLMAGVFWAADTVILGIALAMTPFVSGEQAVLLAPLVSTFLHDFCSALWMLLYTGIRREFRGVARALKTRSGKFIILGALLGGPVGMSGYVAAIGFMGAGYTSIVSSIFPAIGALLSCIFLKEKMKGYQIAGLVVSLLGVIGLGYTPGEAGQNYVLGFLCAAVCVLGWSLEAVICAYGMRDPEVTNEHALMIRQGTSAIFYGLVLLPVVKGWGITLSAAASSAMPVILAAAFFGTASYLCYYLAIHRLGAAKAMPLDVTYSAWALVFGAVFLHTIPDWTSIGFGILTVCGSIVAACDVREIVRK